MADVATRRQDAGGVRPQPTLQGSLAANPSNSPIPGTNYAIPRRPVSVSYLEPVGQKAQSSPIPPADAISTPPLVNEGNKTTPDHAYLSQSASPASNYQGPQRKQGDDRFTQPQSATSDTSTSSNQPHVSGPYFPPPPGHNSLPTLPSSQSNPQPYFPPPPPQPGSNQQPYFTPPKPASNHQPYSPPPPPQSTFNHQPYFPPPPSQPAVIPPYDPSTITKPPHPLYIPIRTTSFSTSQTPSTPSSCPTTASYGSPTIPVSPFQHTASTSRRISTWSKDTATKYWNKETAKKAYQGSRDFLVKTNQQLERVIEPMMPILAVTHPDLAAAYQIGQALQKPKSPQVALPGVVATQGSANNLNGGDGGGMGGLAGNIGAAPPGQASAGGLDSMGSLLASLNQPAAGNSLGGVVDANPPLTALSQSEGANTDTIPLIAVPAQAGTTNSENSSATERNTFPAGLRSPGLGNPYPPRTDSNALLATLSQPHIDTSYVGSIDPAALRTSLMQAGSANIPGGNQEVTQALIASFIQQQSNAATANMFTTPGATPGTPFQATAPGVSQAQVIQAQFIASLLQQVQGQAQPTCVANHNTYTQAAFSPSSSAQYSPESPETRQTSDTVQNNTMPGPATAQDIPQSSEQQTPVSASTYIPSPNFASRPPHTAQSTAITNPPRPEGTQPEPAWVHHQELAFGLDDILLPAHHNLHSIGAPNFLVGHLLFPGAPPARLEIKLLYTAAQARHDVLALQTLGASDGVRVLEPCGAVAFGGVVGIACAVCTHDDGDDNDCEPPAVLYRAVAQSPHGHGLAVSVHFTGARQLPAVRARAAAVLASVRWADRARVCRSVAARVLGRWEYVGEGAGEEVKRLVFQAGGRYAYDKGEGATVDVDVQAAELQGCTSYDPDHTRGQFEIYEYGSGLTHLVLAEDYTGGVEVQVVEFGEGVMIVKGKKFVQVQGGSGLVPVAYSTGYQ